LTVVQNNRESQAGESPDAMLRAGAGKH
jgi:hypothetical protein